MKVYLLIEEAYTPEDGEPVLGVYATPEAAMANSPNPRDWKYDEDFGWRCDTDIVRTYRIDEYEVQE